MTLPADMPDNIRIARAFIEDPDTTRAAPEGTAIKFVATTEGVKRDGLDLRLEGLDTSNYERNPVFLWAHQYSSPPIGKVTKIRKLKKRMEMWVEFDQNDDFALDVERKYREGFLTAVSIGWIILDYERGVEEDDARYIITASDLLDLSAVPVPGDPDALMPRELAAVRSLAQVRESGWTPHYIGTGDDMNFTLDNRTTDPPYRMPVRVTVPDGVYPCSHIGDDGEADWTRVATEMVDLLVSGAEDPESYTHLTRHYRKLGKTAPEQVPATPGLFLEGEWDIYQEARMDAARKRLVDAAHALRDTATSVLEEFETTEENTGTDTAVIDALGAIRDAFPEDSEGEMDE